MEIILLGILGVVVSTVIGSIWYSPKTPMGRIHMDSLGFSKLSKEDQDKRMAEAKPTMWKYYLASMILSLLTSIFIAFIMVEQSGYGYGIIYGEVGMVWLCFTVPLVGNSLLWGNCDKHLRWKKFVSDILENLVTYFVIICVFSLFKI